MVSLPSLMQMRRAARQRGQVVVQSRDDLTLCALVVPDFWGKGSDPRGERAARAAFDDDQGMTLKQIAEELGLS